MLNFITRKFAWILVGLGVILMSFSLKVRHFEGQHLLVEFSDFESTSVPDHWVDYLLLELAETGQDLPGKNIQFRDGKTDLRKKNTSAENHVAYPDDLPLNIIAFNSCRCVLPISEDIPEPGYYTSLSLLHLF